MEMIGKKILKRRSMNQVPGVCQIQQCNLLTMLEIAYLSHEEMPSLARRTPLSLLSFGFVSFHRNSI